MADNVYDERNIITALRDFSNGDAMVAQLLEYLNPASLSIVCAKLKEFYISETCKDKGT